MKDWQNLSVNADRLRSDIDTLSGIGRGDDGTLYRPAFSPQYEEARVWLKSRLDAAGIKNRNDAAGNLIGRVGLDDVPCIMSGSHIDTVPNGGVLDGAYGVLAALEVARVIRESEIEYPKAYECVTFVDEEGHYFDGLGSKAVNGDLSLDEVNTACDVAGNLLTTDMLAAGFDPNRILEAVRAADEISAFVELHIEQGAVLEALEIPLGNVETIVGTSNLWITFNGESNHSGTTPMDLRRDAFTGAAEFTTRAREHILKQGTPGRVRITYGIVELEPQSHNIIPARVRLFQEIREVSDEIKKQLVEDSKRLACEIAGKHRLRVDFEHIPDTKAMTMSKRVRSAIADSAERLDLDLHDMPSGAVHDAQNLARLTDSGMIFVPSKGGRSHCPDEYTDWQYLEQGANILLQTVLRLIHD